MKEPATLGQVLAYFEPKPRGYWLYLPEHIPWGAETKCMVLESVEVPPEEEDLQYAGIPELARQNDMIDALPMSSIEEIVHNARAQKAHASVEELVEAFLYYYDNDAFIDWEG